MQSASRLPHLVRGSSAAAIATFAALFSHVLGGGATPSALGIAVPLLLSVVVCVLLAGRRLSLARLSVSVIASQSLFHFLFVLGAGGASAPGADFAPAHQHGALTSQSSINTEHAATMLHDSGSMWLAHGIAAVITIAFLVRGERAIARLRAIGGRLADWSRRCLARVRRARLPLVFPLATPRILQHDCDSWSILSRVTSSTLGRRGPPAFPRTRSL